MEFKYINYFNYDTHISANRINNIAMDMNEIKNYLDNHVFYNYSLYHVNHFYNTNNLAINYLKFIFIKNKYAFFNVNNFHYIAWSAIYLYCIFIFIMIFNKSLIKYFNNSTFVFLIKRFYNQLEQQIGNFEDFITLITLFSIIFLLNFCYFYNFNIGKMFNYTIAVCLFFAVAIPLRIVFYFGNSFIVYIKGASLYKKSKIELIYDLTNFFAFFLRFLLQLIRLVLLFLFYFLIHEYIFELPKNWLTNYANSYAYNDQNNITLTIVLIIRWVFEFFDSLMTIFTQITAFFLISFWLFSFLYTTILKKKLPNFKKFNIK